MTLWTRFKDNLSLQCFLWWRFFNISPSINRIEASKKNLFRYKFLHIFCLLSKLSKIISKSQENRNVFIFLISFITFQKIIKLSFNSGWRCSLWSQERVVRFTLQYDLNFEIIEFVWKICTAPIVRTNHQIHFF